jgi:DNA-binding GntR family transcriptional regulator
MAFLMMSRLARIRIRSGVAPNAPRAEAPAKAAAAGSVQPMATTNSFFSRDVKKDGPGLALIPCKPPSNVIVNHTSDELTMACHACQSFFFMLEKFMAIETLKKQVYDRVLARIVNKDYPVDYILKEKELSEHFGVSKAPVREALIELSKENIVKSIPRAGYRIVRFTEKDIHEATELRLLLELPALDRIIPARTDILQTLSGLVEESHNHQKDAAVSLDAWWDNNIRFHVALNAAADNTLLTGILETVLQRLKRAVAQLFGSGPSEVYRHFMPDTHGSLLQAIEKGDKREAKKVLSRDVLSIRKQFTYR